jgi:hypothetical protein
VLRSVRRGTAPTSRLCHGAAVPSTAPTSRLCHGAAVPSTPQALPLAPQPPAATPRSRERTTKAGFVLRCGAQPAIKYEPPARPRNCVSTRGGTGEKRREENLSRAEPGLSVVVLAARSAAAGCKPCASGTAQRSYPGSEGLEGEPGARVGHFFCSLRPHCAQ